MVAGHRTCSIMTMETKAGKKMNRIQKKFINDAIDDPEPLSEWEHEFVNSLADRDNDYVLTDKQNTILNRISQKYI